jgi:hypothetical protein
MFNRLRSKPCKTARQTKPRKNTKITGERSEAAFLHRASNLGFGVAKPWGDSRRYDFILDNGASLYRIQVKCTESIRARAYETRATYTVGKGRAVYTRADVDFLAAHVVPLDIWYILPVEVCTPAPMLRFYPHRTAKKMRLEPYREAWHLLQSPDDEEKQKEEKIDNAGKPRRGLDLQASADEECVGTDAFVRPANEAKRAPFVILSEDAAPRSGSAPQSKDPYLAQPHRVEERGPDAPARAIWLTPRPTKPVIIRH